MAKDLMLLLIFSATVVDLVASDDDCSQYCVDVVSLSNCDSDNIFTLESMETTLTDSCVLLFDASFTTKGFASAVIEYTMKTPYKNWNSYVDVCSFVDCRYEQGFYELPTMHEKISSKLLRALTGTNYVHFEVMHDTGTSCVDLELNVGGCF